jgi:hypothetical protein
VIRCRYCRRGVYDEEPGARCPRCREPLYERNDIPTQAAENAGLEESRCAAHPRNLAVGTCRNCGNYICNVCWTRWRGSRVCVACVERALDSGEASPQEARAHFRQALLALVFGVVAWGMILLAIFGITLSSGNLVAVGLGFMLVIGSLFVSAPGVAQGAAAIRARGDHMILATCGLLLSAVQAGAVIGLLLVELRSV